MHKLDSCRGCPEIEAQLQIVPSFLSHAKQNMKRFNVCVLNFCYIYVLHAVAANHTDFQSYEFTLCMV